MSSIEREPNWQCARRCMVIPAIAVSRSWEPGKATLGELTLGSNASRQTGRICQARASQSAQKREGVGVPHCDGIVCIKSLLDWYLLRLL